MNISITISNASASARIAELAKSLDDRRELHGSIATAALEVTKDHIQEKYVPRDGPRGDFWADVRDKTASSYNDKSATVTLNEVGIALRYHGGEVTPGKSNSSYTGKLTKALSIPSLNVPVSGGRQVRPGNAGLLAFIKKAGGGDTIGYLVEGSTKTRKKKTKRGDIGTDYIVPKAGGMLMFTLRTITRHKGDPGILPSEDDLTSAAIMAITDYLDA